MALLSPEQAGERLGLTARAVRLLVANGTLPAERVGRAIVIREEDLGKAAARRKPGWEKGKARK